MTSRWRFTVTRIGDLQSVTAEWLDVVPPGIDDYTAAVGLAASMYGQQPDLWRVPTPAAVFGAPVEFVDPVPA